MAFDPFEVAIRGLPPNELTSLGEQIDAQIAQLKSQRDAVRRVLARKSPGSSGGRSSSPRRRRGPNAADRRRDLLKRVIDAEPDRHWLPVDLEARFAQEGDGVSLDYLRTLGRRMVEDGDIARHPSGNGFISISGLASANGSGQEPLKEAET
jgi:hypothetical protein